MLTGHCLCGEITYSADAEPAIVANCHCTECRRQSGAAFSTVVGVPRPSFVVTGGTLSSFTTVGTDSGLSVERRFCANCGTPVVSLLEAMPDLALIKAGSLDDQAAIEPQLEVWNDSAVPWTVGEGTTTPRHARGLG
jgi:hypothetical protein